MSCGQVMVVQEHLTGARSYSTSLKIAPVRAYGTSDKALLEACSVKILLSSCLATELKLNLLATDRNIKISNCRKAATRGIFRNLSLYFSRKSLISGPQNGYLDEAVKFSKSLH